MLLARLRHELAEVLAELPREPAPPGGRAALLRPGRLASGLEREIFERLQGILPLRHRRQQGGQRPRAEPRVQPGRLLAARRRGTGTSLLHLHVGLADDGQALCERPGEAVDSDAVRIADQRLTRGRFGVLPELSHPAALQPLQHRAELRGREHHRGDMRALAHFAGTGDVVHDERLGVALPGGAKELREQRPARRRVVAHEGQQRQGEARGCGEHVAFAGPRPLLGDGRLDEPARLVVVASQRGDEGPCPGVAGSRSLALSQPRGKGVEDRVHLVETALQDADERDVRGERRRIRPQLAARFDDRLGRRGGVDDVHQAAGERAVPPCFGQRAEQAGGAGLGQELPPRRADPVAVDMCKAAGDRVAAQLHRRPGLVVVVRVPGMHLTVAGHDPVEQAAPMRLHRQPRRPVRRCPEAGAPPRREHEPTLHELPVGVPEPCVRQTAPPRSDVAVVQRMVQHPHDLRRGADMRVHDPVDERRGLSVGRQGVEVIGEVLAIGHGGGHSSIQDEATLRGPTLSPEPGGRQARPSPAGRAARAIPRRPAPCAGGVSHGSAAPSH